MTKPPEFETLQLTKVSIKKGDQVQFAGDWRTVTFIDSATRTILVNMGGTNYAEICVVGDLAIPVRRKIEWETKTGVPLEGLRPYTTGYVVGYGHLTSLNHSADYGERVEVEAEFVDELGVRRLVEGPGWAGDFTVKARKQ